jgi:putative ABC transport system permease protein
MKRPALSERRGSNRPPILARALLRLCLPARLREAIAGDIEEQWQASGRNARRYWSDALQSIADCWRGRFEPSYDDRGGRRADAVARTLGQDARFATRMMLRAPGFTLAAVLTLAVGIGGSTTIFSAVYPVIFQPLPYPNAERVLFICDRGQDGSCLDVTFGTYRELLARRRTFESLAVIRPWQPVLVGTAEPERLEGERTSAAYFDVLGIQPALGRGFDPADDRPGGPRVVILSDGLWKRRFGADPSIVGRDISLGGIRHTVIGVMPRSFENVLAPAAEVWTLLQYDPALPRDGPEWGHHLRMVGRLRPDTSLVAARDDVDGIARAPLPDFPRVPWASLQNGFVTQRLHDELTRGVRPALLAFSGAVALVLLIAAANVSHLLLARTVQRRREFAMRAALGADGRRLTRQLVVEGLLLAAPGGALGILAAHAGVDALVALGPLGLPRLDAIAVSGPVLAFAAIVTIAVGLGVTLLPALHAIRGDLQHALREGGRTAAGGPRRARQALVVAEVALALVLLVSAGLLFRSLRELVAVSPGFDPSSLVTAQVQVSGERFREDAAVRQFFGHVVERMEAIPGVTAAAATSLLPFSGAIDRYGVQLERAAAAVDAEADTSAYRYAVTPRYFDTMKIPLRRGRLLDARDRAGAQPVVVISESLARRGFPGLDPIGQRMHVGPTDRPWFTVVGVVGDVAQASLERDDASAVYVAPSQWHFADGTMWIVARATAPEGVPAAIRGAVASVDRHQPVVRMTTMPALLAGAAADRRFALFVFGVFGGVALVLAITGLYTALARSVTERTREIGVRAALGATRGEILAMILRQGLGLTAVGIALGVGGAAASTRLLETFLFGTSSVEPSTYAAVTALFSLVATAACLVPAVRAVSIDPAITLRAE